MNRFYEWLTGKYTKPAGKLAMVVVYALASTAFVLAVVALFSRSRTFGNLAAAFAIVGFGVFWFVVVLGGRRFKYTEEEYEDVVRRRRRGTSLVAEADGYGTDEPAADDRAKGENR